MTNSQLTHLSAAVLIGLLCFALAYFLFRCPEVTDTLPPIQDETAITIQVERRIRALEVRPLLNKIKADSIARAKHNKQVPTRIIYKYHEQAKHNWSLNDSLAAGLFLSRIRASIPDTVRSEGGKSAN